MSTRFCSYSGNCISHFTGHGCETCPRFIRTGENIEEVRTMHNSFVEQETKELNERLKYEAEMQAETDKVWEEYCKKQKEADEYAEYLRLKRKFEGQNDD